MDPGETWIKQIDQLLGRVELVQQAVAQVYIELQALREAMRIPVAEVAEQPAQPGSAVPALPVAKAFYSLRPVDRRASPRRMANQILIGISSALDDSPPFVGWVLDYSSMGLGLFVDKKLAPGAFLRVRPHLAEASCPWKEVQVKNTSRYLDGWRLGCQLDEALSQEDLRQLGLE